MARLTPESSANALSVIPRLRRSSLTRSPNRPEETAATIVEIPLAAASSIW
jgi:hypothetical protein